jgi:hypothetical protein
MSFNVQSFTCTYNTIIYIHGAIPLVSLSPCWFPFCSPLFLFVSPSTYLAPSSCDRNRPPPSQVACKLTPFAPPFTQLSHPLQIPRTPTAPRLTMTTSGIFRLLLSGTIIMPGFEYGISSACGKTSCVTFSGKTKRGKR